MNAPSTAIRVALFLAATPLFGQGNLTPPPGPPAPTMKSLDQIEPRRPIASVPFTIDQSGSYYLTGNLQFTAGSGDAISIAVSNVTLDLMGFTLASSPVVTGDAIHMNPGLRNIAVTNGVIAGNTLVAVKGVAPNQTWTVAAAGFNKGINAVSTPEAGGCHFSHLRISGCRSFGLDGGERAMVEQVTAIQNGLFGISISNDGNVANCTASSNGNTGISNNGGSVTNCAASSNGNNGINGASVANSRASGNDGTGIGSTAGSVTNCHSSSNGTGIAAISVANSVAIGNRSFGISATCVTACVVTSNGSFGISASCVTNCAAYTNGSTGINGGFGVVAFCSASGNNTNNNGSVDIFTISGTRTGNSPTP